MRRNKKLPVIRQALLMSLISMFVCVVMLVGMTYAWFTDSASASVNLIRSGNINVTLESYTDNTKSWSLVQTTSSKELFIPQDNNNNSWAPGSTASAYFRIKNTGDIPARCGFSVKINGTASELFKYTVQQVPAGKDGLPADSGTTTVNTISLKTNESAIILVTVTFLGSTSRESHDTSTTTPVNLSLNVLAVQDSITKGSDAEKAAFAAAEGNMPKSSAEGRSKSTDPSGSEAEKAAFAATEGNMSKSSAEGGSKSPDPSGNKSK